MRSLLDVPNSRNATCLLADWVEMSTLFRDDRSISSEDLVRALVQGSNAPIDESEDEEDSPPQPSERITHTARGKASAVFHELGNRQESIGADSTNGPTCAYPFEVDGDLLRLRAEPKDWSNAEKLYFFLLTISRASMESASRSLAGIDPTKVFERLCADVLRNFWGGASPHSNSFIMGTATSGHATRSFPELIGDLCKYLPEAVGWKEGAPSPGAGDGGLDLVVWRRFSDDRSGSLIGFAQCKTGDGWRQHLGRHHPGAVSSLFFKKAFVIDPLPVYMVPCRVDSGEWDNVLREHRGLVFDRCRIAQYGTSISPSILRDCKSWFYEALRREVTTYNKRTTIAMPRVSSKKRT